MKTERNAWPTAVALLVAAIAALVACKSPPPPPIIVDPLVLDEISPKPREVVVQKVLEYEPIYAVLKIVEVAEENGVQKSFLVKLGADRTALAVGVKGEIAEDEAFAKVIGAYKVKEIYGDFMKAEIETLNYKIGANAWIRYKIGEKLRGGN